MKTSNVVLSSVLFSFSFIIFSCDNTSYEIETIEDDAPIVKTAVIDTQQPAGIQAAEIKEIKISENPVGLYTIQIGAFRNELNARECLEKAKSSLDIELNYVQLDGLFKLRTKTFNSSQEAESELKKIISLGFAGSFVILAEK